MKEISIIIILVIAVTNFIGCNENTLTKDSYKEEWVLKYSNPSYNLTDVCFIDDKIGFTVGALGVILRTTTSGEQWDIIDSVETPSPSLRKIDFFNSNIGLIVGNNGIIRRTSDGGNTWITTYLAPQNSINDICIINEQECFIIMGSSIYKTTNAGVDWDKIYSYPDPYKTFRDIYFSSASIGYGLVMQAPVIFFGAIIKTIDSGKNWTELNMSFENPLYSCSFVNDDYGYVTDLEGKLYKTTDGGESWTLPSQTNLGGVTFLNFISQNIGYGYKLDGKLIKTYNGGKNWEVLLFDNNEPLNSLFYNKINKSFFLVGNKGIYKCANPKL